DNEAYRPHWVGLRLCDGRHGRRRSSRKDQAQKSTTAQFHGGVSPAKRVRAPVSRPAIAHCRLREQPAPWYYKPRCRHKAVPCCLRAPRMQWTNRIGRRVKLRDIHILLAVAQAGTMSKAAELMGVSHPVISKAITELENTLGVRLF